MDPGVRPMRREFGGSLFPYNPLGVLGIEDSNCAFSLIGCGSEAFHGTWL